MPKSMLVLSCLHVGHKGGLCTRGKWQSLESDDPKDILIGTVQRQISKWFDNVVCATRPDIVTLAGDMIDGDQHKSNGEDLWSTSTHDQAEEALRVLRPLTKHNPKFFVVKGTRYHDKDKREDYLAGQLKAECCEPQVFLDVNGVKFDVKHKLTGGNTPAGRPGMRNQMLANLQWARRDGQPIADIFVRGHLHTYYFEGDETYTGIVVPGCQWYSEFGQLNVSRPISLGCVFFPSIEKGMKPMEVPWRPLIARLPALAPRVFKA